LFDVTLVTCKKYFAPSLIDKYISNILFEEELLKNALEKINLTVDIAYWDDQNYDWSNTKIALIRTTWDYYQKLDKFVDWIEGVSKQTKLINDKNLLLWNLNKKYLLDLEKKGINIVPTRMVTHKETDTFSEICAENGWNEVIVKPAVSAAAFNTFRIKFSEFQNFESKFQKLLSESEMIIQPFFSSILKKGEASLMAVNGKFTHGILKRAKQGDFRVQDDFGGTVHQFSANKNEIFFAENVFKCCDEVPIYGRVDIMWNNSNDIFLSELEIVEPEIWSRKFPKNADYLAEAIKKVL
tara:strand:- start:489 stop:1379 length:891 start_codon:yes stop_codon:yes gene_type:complete